MPDGAPGATFDNPPAAEVIINSRIMQEMLADLARAKELLPPGRVNHASYDLTRYAASLQNEVLQEKNKAIRDPNYRIIYPEGPEKRALVNYQKALPLYRLYIKVGGERRALDEVPADPVVEMAQITHLLKALHMLPASVNTETLPDAISNAPILVVNKNSELAPAIAQARANPGLTLLRYNDIIDGKPRTTNTIRGFRRRSSAGIPIAEALFRIRYHPQTGQPIMNQYGLDILFSETTFNDLAQNLPPNPHAYTKPPTTY